MRIAMLTVLCLFVGLLSVSTSGQSPTSPEKETGQLELGNFSVSLVVKDLKASREFYEKLGFRVFAGSIDANMFIMQNETSTIGLFHGMFEKNLLTFNPGWDRNAASLPKFKDVRDIQRLLKSKGITPVTAADESESGPANLMVIDPDGNPILIDQHVPRAKK